MINLIGLLWRLIQDINLELRRLAVLLVKNLPVNVGRRKRHEFSSRVGKIPGRRKWQPTSVFLPGKSHGQRSLAGYNPWGLRVRCNCAHTHLAFRHSAYLQNIKSCLQIRVSPLPHLQNCLCTRPTLTALWHRYCYFSHFADRGIKTWRG